MGSPSLKRPTGHLTQASFFLAVSETEACYSSSKPSSAEAAVSREPSGSELAASPCIATWPAARSPPRDAVAALVAEAASGWQVPPV